MGEVGRGGAIARAFALRGRESICVENVREREEVLLC